MYDFKTLHGIPVIDAINYIKDYLEGREGVELLIGSDSQSYSNSKTCPSSNQCRLLVVKRFVV